MAANYTRRQFQFHAVIDYSTKLNGIPPAEADMPRDFRLTVSNGFGSSATAFRHSSRDCRR